MSHPARLPPRCPFQNKSPIARTLSGSSQTTQRDDELQARHRRFPSQESFFEEQPAWLDNLLSNTEATPSGLLLRRSASDSMAVLPIIDVWNSTLSSARSEEPMDGTEASGGFDDGYVYGPNSPRQKSKLTHSESSMVSAVLESVPQNPLQFLVADLPTASKANESELNEEVHGAAGDVSEKISRRHSGQRSRVRKLQYIAELERTVDIFQTMGSDLQAKVTSLEQQHYALYVENKKLKWLLLNLAHKKRIKDGEHRYLKTEVERLKVTCGRHRRSKSASCYEIGAALEEDTLMLDMKQLSLGRNEEQLRHGFGGSGPHNSSLSTAASSCTDWCGYSN